MGDPLTAAGRAEADEIGRRYDVPADAVTILLAAIRRGGGRQAQFSHPALGGMGQWSRGGGIMIGDMFNHSLKAKVERLCSALAEHVDEDRLFAAARSGSDVWWPRDLGRPSSAGRQNEQAYACFPDERRLAIRDADGVRLYDTGDHRISGVSQQQGGGRDLTFSTQLGTVQLSELSRVEANEPQEASSPPRDEREGSFGRREQAKAGSPVTGKGADVLALIERLHDLRRNDILTEEEYVAKKTELLGRL